MKCPECGEGPGHAFGCRTRSVVCESCERCQTFNESRVCDWCSKLPKTLKVEGMIDARGRIEFKGEAQRMEDGTWRCLAVVEGALCIVEVKIRPQDDVP